MLALGIYFVAIPFLRPSPAFSLIDQTTLLVLKGTVQVQRGGAGAFATVTNDQPMQAGDQVRTGPDGYAVVTYFDGSTTEIDPGSDITLNRLDKLPGGGQSISFKQEAGRSWNRVEKLGAGSRFETTTATATVFVRGTEYRVRVEPGQLTIVESVTGPVVVETVINGQVFTVTVEPGFQTTVAPGQPPTPPEPTPPSTWAFVLTVNGPVSFYLTDQNDRSTGFQPQADAFVNQIPGAKYSVGGGGQSLDVPDPIGSYDLSFKPQGEGGDYTARVTTLRDGVEIGSRGGGLALPLFQGGQIRGALNQGDGFDRSSVLFNEGSGASFGPVSRIRSTDGGHTAFSADQVQGNNAASALEQGGSLVAMCHRTGDGYQPRSMASSAVDAHVSQGDVFPPCPGAGAAPPAPAAVRGTATAMSNQATAAATQSVATGTAAATETPAGTRTEEPTATGAPTATQAPTTTQTPTATQAPTATEVPTGTPDPTDTPGPAEIPSPTADVFGTQLAINAISTNVAAAQTAAAVETANAAQTGFSFSPATSSQTVGASFSVQIRLAAGSQQVDGVQVRVTYDPTKLQVVDADPATPGCQVAKGTALSAPIQYTCDTAGRVNYAAAQLTAPFPSGSFTVATITFTALAATGPSGTPVGFVTTGRPVDVTQATFDGRSLSFAATNLLVVITS